MAAWLTALVIGAVPCWSQSTTAAPQATSTQAPATPKTTPAAQAPAETAPGPAKASDPTEKYKATAYVNDFAGMMDANVKAEIEAVCMDLAEKRGTEMAIVTVDSLEGLPIKEFSTKLFNRWGVGDRETNRGIMVLLAKSERKWRITLGLGLESTFTDEEMHALGMQMVPLLQRGRYGEALLYVAKKLRDEVMEKVKTGPGLENPQEK